MNKILTIKKDFDNPKKEGIIAEKFKSQRAITEFSKTHPHTNFIHTRMGKQKKSKK